MRENNKNDSDDEETNCILFYGISQPRPLCLLTFSKIWLTDKKPKVRTVETCAPTHTNLQVYGF